MLKNISLLLALIFTASSFAAAPLGVRGQASSTTLYPYNIQVPNNQITDLGGGKALINTGNNNLIANGGFENASVQSSWSLTNGSSAVETSAVIQGQQSIKLTLTAQALEFFQTSTRYAAQFADGVQGAASIRVKTSVSGVFACPVQNSAVQYSLCAAHPGDGKWALLKVPFVLGGTNNGIAVISGTLSSGVVTPGSITGTVYVDDAYVGTDAGIADVSIITPWASYTPTFTGFGTVSTQSFLWRQVGSNIEIQGRFASGTPTATEARITLPGGYSAASTYTTLEIAGKSASVVSNQQLISLIEPNSTYLTFGISNSTSAELVKLNATSFVSATSTVSVYANIRIANLAGSTQVFASQCGAACENVFSAKISGSGVVSDETGGDWISSVSDSTFTSTITFTSGLFTSTPNCVATPSSDNGAEIRTAGASTSSIVVRVYLNGTGASSDGFNIVCHHRNRRRLHLL
jgi:hypothetical protein